MPSSRVLSFADPHRYQASIRSAEVEVFVTKKGTFCVELTQINLHRLWMQRASETLPRVFHSAVSKKRAPIVFLAHANQAPMQHSGMEVSPGAIIVDALGATHHHKMTPEELTEAGSVINGRELAVPSVTYLVRPPPVLMGRLLSLHENAGRLAKAAPERLAHREVARFFEQALVSKRPVDRMQDGRRRPAPRW